MVDEAAGSSMSDEAVESVQENVAGSLEDLVWDKYDFISENDLDGNIEREIRSIVKVDKGMDCDNLEDPDQKQKNESKIEGLEINTKHWNDLEEKEQDPTMKLNYNSAKELCVAKKIAHGSKSWQTS